MKRIMLKRLLVLGLGCSMLCSSIACGKTNSTSQNAEKSQNKPTQQVSSGQSDAVGTELEPIKFTIGTTSTSMSNGVHTDDYPILKVIEEKTGVTLDFVSYDAEKFSLLASSGDLPDIMTLPSDGALVKSVISSGQLMVLNDLLDECGQNIKENISDALIFTKILNGQGKDVYYLPVGISYINDTPNRNAFLGFRARADIYKAVGSPEINNEDDFLEALNIMQQYQRKQTGDNSIYGLSSWVDWGMWPYIVPYIFSHGFVNGNYGSYSVDAATGEIQSNYLDDTSLFWNQMRFYNRAYRKGVFDPDGFIQKGEQYTEKVKSGKVLCSIDWSEPDISVCGEEAICAILPGTAFPYITGVYQRPQVGGWGPSSARAISTNCKDPKRAMQFLNWCDSLEGMRILTNGVQGEDWDVIDGEPQLIGKMLEAFKSGTERDYRDTRLFSNSGNLCSGSVAEGDGYPVELCKTESFYTEMATVAEKSFASQFGSEFSYPGQVYEKWVKEGMVETETTDVGIKKYCLAPGISDEGTQKEAEAADYFMSNVQKVIMADSDEAFEKEMDAIIARFKEIGMEDTWNEIQAAHKSGFEKYDELFGKN